MGQRYIWQQKKCQSVVASAAEPAGGDLENAARRAAAGSSAFTEALSDDTAAEAQAASLADEGTQSNAIEGVKLSRGSFFASALRRLDALPCGPIDRTRAPAIEARIDATERSHEPLTHDRLHRWQEAPLAHQTNAFVPPLTGMYRVADDDMQIVTRHAAGREPVHYTALPAKDVPNEMQRFIDWVNRSQEADTFTGAAIAHLWFEIIHPYADGNGRAGRLLWDRQITRAAANPALVGGRWWSISHEIAPNVASYYHALGAVSTGLGNPEDFARWGMKIAIDAFKRTRQVARDVVRGHEITARSAQADLNVRQRELLGLLVKFGSEGFEQGVSVRKYCSLTKASRATASRHLAALVDAGFLQLRGQGRSRVYDLAWDTSANGVETNKQ